MSRCAEASQQELDAAVAAACDAFPAWRKTPPPRRAEILFRVAELLKARKDDFARWITFEMGKVTMEARGDVQEAIDMARYMAGEGRRMFGHTAPSELRDKFCMSLRDPIGVVAVITPWNFPIAVPSWKILPAFVLGNTVVWKPSSDTPVCAAKFVEAFVEAGLPPGVLNLVLGKGAEIGDALVRHRDVRLVTFTGSNEVGHRVSVTAAETGKRCALEMGGKKAIIVLDDADLALAVDGIVWSAFGASGQRCTAASRIIVHNTVRGPLTELLLERIKQLKIGNGLDPPTTVGPVINHAALEKIDRYVHIGLDEGSRLLVGGERFSEGDCRRGCFYRPTVFDNVTPAMHMARDEIFGPVVCIIEAGSLGEAVAINNDVPYGLVSSIYTQNSNRAFAAMRELTTGIVYVNAGTIGSEVASVWRHARHRQWRARSWAGCARHVQRMENGLCRLQRAVATRADRHRDHNTERNHKMKTHELKSHQSDQDLEKLLREYVANFLTNNTAGRMLDEMLRKAGIGIRPIMDHLTFRTHNIDRRAEEFVRYGFEHAETLEYTNWFAKVYRRDGYPALFIDQAFPGERGKGSIIPAWVEKFGDRHLHHVAVLVDDIDKAIAAMKENGIAFTGEIVGRHSGALRQIFTQAEKREGEPFTVLELTERHFGFKGFSPPQAQGLMESTVAHKKAA